MENRMATEQEGKYERRRQFGYPTFLLACFVDRASRYNRVQKKQLDAQIILSTFRQTLHVSAYLGPSSGGKTVCIQQFVLIFLDDCLLFWLDWNWVFRVRVEVPIQPEQQRVM
jgi:hypothetical protein